MRGCAEGIEGMRLSGVGKKKPRREEWRQRGNLNGTDSSAGEGRAQILENL
jgi:hypothetical protein